jgi:hypothetical protein
MMNRAELAVNYAIDFYVSDLGGITHEEFYDALSENIIPEQVLLWEPFENYDDAYELIDLIDNLANMFDDFVVDLYEMYDKEIENEMQIKQKEQEKWEAIHKNFPEEFKNENTN